MEKGRWKGLIKSQRLCKQCKSGSIEDEKHFLLACPKYDALRKEFFAKSLNMSNGKWDFNNYIPEDAFSILLQGTGDEMEMNIFNLLHKFLEQCFECRNADIITLIPSELLLFVL